MYKVHTSHRSLFICVEQPPSTGGVSDVERVVQGWDPGVLSSVHDEGVGLTTLHHQLRNESVVDVPCNAPPGSAWGQRSVRMYYTIEHVLTTKVLHLHAHISPVLTSAANKRVFLTSDANVAPHVSGGSDMSSKGRAVWSIESLILVGLAGQALERHTVTGASSPQMEGRIPNCTHTHTQSWINTMEMQGTEENGEQHRRRKRGG